MDDQVATIPNEKNLHTCTMEKKPKVENYKLNKTKTFLMGKYASLNYPLIF